MVCRRRLAMRYVITVITTLALSTACHAQVAFISELGHNSCGKYLAAVHGHAVGIGRFIDSPEGQFSDDREKVAKKTYIRAPKYPQPAFDQALSDCKADKSWRTFETTEAGHEVMVDAPQWLVDILDSRSRPRRSSSLSQHRFQP